MLPALPSRALILCLAGMALVCTALAFTELPMPTVALAGAALLCVLVALLGLDAFISVKRWQGAPLGLRRQLPQAFAVGRGAPLSLTLQNPGAHRCRGELFDLADPSMTLTGMPLAFDVGARQTQTFRVEILPTERGLKHFAGGQVRLRSALGLIDWDRRIGEIESRRVFPNFANQGSFDWLAGERRLKGIGVKTVRRRGVGTDFDQLVDYRPGDAIRHIDWKATQRHHRPVVRQFQDDRDQRVLLLLDCGRRMRSDDTQHGIGASHFDQALNALMQLAFVALTFGDAVGAMTFGTAEGKTRIFAPRKGRRSLNALMAELGDVEPSPTFSDYVRGAADLMARQRKRSLVVLITNCRDEDAPELETALKLLRSRHLVVVANLREQIVAQIAAQPLTTEDSALEAAAALDYEERRRVMLQRFAIGGALTIDCEPQRLGVELVNRYTQLKRAGAI